MKIKIIYVAIALASFFVGSLLLAIGAEIPHTPTFVAGVIMYAICVFSCLIGYKTMREYMNK